MIVAALLACVAAQPLDAAGGSPGDAAAAPAARPSPAEHRFSFAGVPTATFNTDEGFGTGGVGTMYHQHGGVAPYRDAFTLNVFISSKLVQAHAITWDALRPFDIPGRALVKLGYYSTVSQNYCGVGNEVTCAPGDAVARARALGFADGTAAFEDFVRRYYLMRFIRPYATLLARPWLRDKPWRTELLVGWRGALTIPGELAALAPYPDNRFAEDHPDGEPGFSSVPTLGLIVDDRDAETFPTRGFFFEASGRAAHPWWGGTWTWAGANASGSFFVEMERAPRLVLATRFLADVIVGEPSVEEMARIGGTNDWIAFGGHVLGRGVREHRYLGKLKVIGQAELRAQLYRHDVWGEQLDHGVAVFSDVGWIGYDVADLRGRAVKLLGGVGISYRLLWNETFSVRADLAVSPDEAEGPGFYVIVGQAF
ncbi:MAG: hypothetical protein A2138_04750 [Deltaproteobacteria bacterium RBG_16_71_12]|nr:MAG: hypothetical protein A2138_04750 [Deltaproteobacteria bacterium RBG_16_71_12]